MTDASSDIRSRHTRATGRILVVGSANMDLVVSTDRFPEPGETLFATSFARFPGGKGANQAVAAARLGGAVQFVGRMGVDSFGDELAEVLARDGVGLEGLIRQPGAPTGTAVITVDATGQNEILVVSGSNMLLSANDVDRFPSLMRSAHVLLVQLEIPLPTVERAVQRAKEAGVTVVLNPAPACPLSDALLSKVDYLTPNETELGLLTGQSTESTQDLERAARSLLDKGVGSVVVTRGSKGAFLVSSSGSAEFPAPAVHVVDTTAAGDAFNGALALALARGQTVEMAVQFAVRVGSLTVTRAGAQPSLPRAIDLDFLDP